jgi:cytoskeletal protein CcmA (bactofilin family)
VRIEGAFEGDIELDGLLVIGPTGRVTCPELRATSVIVAGAMRGNIRAERVEIRSSGRVWGDVVTASMSTQEGAFLRGQIQMEDEESFSGESTEPTEIATETKKTKVPPKKRRTAKKKKNHT